MRLVPEPERSYLWQWDPSRYRRAYLWEGPSEESVQAQIVKALAVMGIEARQVDAGGADIRGKVFGAMRRASIGVVSAKDILAAIQNVCAAPPGSADLDGCLPPDGRAFYIEVKSPAKINPKTGTILRRSGVPSEDQLAFLDRMSKRGALVGVAWSIDDALAILKPGLVDFRFRA